MSASLRGVGLDRWVPWYVIAWVAVALGACSKSSPSQAEVAALEPSPAVAPSGGGQAASAPSARARRFVRSADLQLEVVAYGPARAGVDAELARAGGYVAQARVERADGAVASAWLELRVPAAELDAFVSGLARFGTVLREELRAEEISEEYYDAQARLGSARSIERRLLQFAEAKTASVNDLLEVERELGRVRGEIESYQGRIAGYDGRVAMSTVSLGMLSRERVSVGTPVAFAERLRHSFRESTRALGGAVRGLLLAIAALLPWLPWVAIGAYVVRRWLRRRVA